jgi:hypothetical protein
MHPILNNRAFKALSEESQPEERSVCAIRDMVDAFCDVRRHSDDQSYDSDCSYDYSVSGLIRDTLIFKTLLAPMRYR